MWACVSLCVRETFLLFKQFLKEWCGNNATKSNTSATLLNFLESEKNNMAEAILEECVVRNI
jgi:hypothetical protein